jgi:hypothetical protein
MDFPLIYCNGDSYSDEFYHPSMQSQTFGYHLGKHLSGFVISKSIQGSCNRRIIRTSMHDLLNQRQCNPNQNIIAVINLSFEIRDEIWVDFRNPSQTHPEESHFVPHQFSKRLFWGEDLINSGLIDWHNKKITLDQADIFLQRWSEGRAFFYNSYAERTNLLLDLIGFCHTLEKNEIKYLIFQGPLAEKLESEYLIDFFKKQLNCKKILDLESFSFCSWCQQHGFVPLDPNEQPGIGHYGPDAHKSFSADFLLPKLKEIYGDLSKL